jgi:hypothetical protein
VWPKSAGRAGRGGRVHLAETSRWGAEGRRGHQA